VIDTILEQPACARFIARKLWAFFAYENPSASVIDSLAEGFRKGRYKIQPLMREMLLSNEFYSERAYRTQIKSPVQWVISTAKVLEIDLPPEAPLMNALRQLGQMPFMPPNVKGWDGGKSWITTSTLLQRYNLASYTVGNGPLHIQPGKKVNPNDFPKRPGRDVMALEHPHFEKLVPLEIRDNGKTVVEKLTLRLFQSPLTEHDKQPFLSFLSGKAVDDHIIAQLIQLMMSTPQYQLA
jgi:hypothetical protein